MALGLVGHGTSGPMAPAEAGRTGSAAQSLDVLAPRVQRLWLIAFRILTARRQSGSGWRQLEQGECVETARPDPSSRRRPGPIILKNRRWILGRRELALRCCETRYEYASAPRQADGSRPARLCQNSRR